jgi:hypothetical protein
MMYHVGTPAAATKVGWVLLDAAADGYERRHQVCSLVQFVLSGAMYPFDLASAVGARQEDRTVAVWTVTPQIVAMHPGREAAASRSKHAPCPPRAAEGTPPTPLLVLPVQRGARGRVRLVIGRDLTLSLMRRRIHQQCWRGGLTQAWLHSRARGIWLEMAPMSNNDVGGGDEAAGSSAIDVDAFYDIRDEGLYSEARRCHEAGAYRAAFIMTCLSISEGLRWRFDEMAKRDGQMANWVEETQKLEAEGRTIDQRILDQAKSSGLVADAEYRKLKYIKDMRNAFAHPTGAEPTRQDVEAALQVAYDVVLSRPPLLGRRFARELVESLFQDLHRLDDVQFKVDAYIDRLVPLLHPDVMPWLLEHVVASTSNVLDDPHMGVFVRRGLWVARRLLELEAAGDDLNAPKWKIELLLTRSSGAAALSLATPTIFGRLSPHLKDMVFGRLAEPAIAAQVLPPDAPSVSALVALESRDLLDPRQRDRLQEAIARAPYSSLQQGIPFHLWAKKVVADLLSRDWYIQNPAAAALNAAEPAAVESCEQSVQVALGRAVLAAADGTANDAELFIEKRSRSDEVWPKPFALGLLLETLVHEDGTFRVKQKWLPSVCRIISIHPESIDIVADTVRILESSGSQNPRRVWATGLEQLNEFAATGGQSVCDAIVEVVARMKGDDSDVTPVRAL